MTTRSQRRQPEPDDPLGVPAFLRVTPAEAARRAAERAATPPAPPERSVTSVKRGEYPSHWLTDPSTRRFVQELEAEKAQRAAEREERRAREKAERPPKINPLAGLVSLKTILSEMGDGAPRRRHAMAAIEDAKLVHTKFHFEPGEATLARVRRVLEKYEPPRKARGNSAANAALFSADAIIRVLVKKNPRKEGTSARERFEFLMGFDGKKVADYLAAKGNPTTLKNSVEKRWVEAGDGKSSVVGGAAAGGGGRVRVRGGAPDVDAAGERRSAVVKKAKKAKRTKRRKK